MKGLMSFGAAFRKETPIVIIKIGSSKSTASIKSQNPIFVPSFTPKCKVMISLIQFVVNDSDFFRSSRKKD